MSGHSKWSQIKHKKGASDQKRSQVFAKLGKIITIAARDGIDPKSNPKLRSAIEKAKSFNMPNDNIEKAIKKVSDKDSVSLQEMRVEILGPAGVAIIVDAITDNKNRTMAELKSIALKNEAKIASEGSLIWLFKKYGQVRVKGILNDDIELLAIENGAIEIQNDIQNTNLTTELENFEKIKKTLEEKQVEIEDSYIDFIPQQSIKLSLQEETKFEKLMEALDNNDDVQEIYSNRK